MYEHSLDKLSCPLLRWIVYTPALSSGSEYDEDVAALTSVWYTLSPRALKTCNRYTSSSLPVKASVKSSVIRIRINCKQSLRLSCPQRYDIWIAECAVKIGLFQAVIIYSRKCSAIEVGIRTCFRAVTCSFNTCNSFKRFRISTSLQSKITIVDLWSGLPVENISFQVFFRWSSTILSGEEK